MEPLQKLRARLRSYKNGLSPQWFYITNRSSAILLLWFYSFYVLGSIFVMFEPYVRVIDLYIIHSADHIFLLVLLYQRGYSEKSENYYRLFIF